MKGLILAGGKGSRLHPLTLAVTKQLLPVYDKPMIYYPLSMLMLAGIRQILIIGTPDDLPTFRRLFGDGSQLGLDFSYAAQAEPRGLADAFLVGEDFIKEDPVCLILGDNIFYGHGLPDVMMDSASLSEGALIFAYEVRDPRQYGVVEFDSDGRAISLAEKPTTPRTNFAVPGIYFYDSQIVKKAKLIRPSSRGELEITDLNKMYLKSGQLRVQPLGRGVAWLDAGTHETLLQASSFVQAVQERQGMLISSPEEIAYRKGYISSKKLIELASQVNNSYGRKLMRLLDNRSVA